MNDLSISTELDGMARAEIVGGAEYIISSPWKYLDTAYSFNQWVNKQGQSYKCYLRVRKYLSRQDRIRGRLN